MTKFKEINEGSALNDKIFIELQQKIKNAGGLNKDNKVAQLSKLLKEIQDIIHETSKSLSKKFSV